MELTFWRGRKQDGLGGTLEGQSGEAARRRCQSSSDPSEEELARPRLGEPHDRCCHGLRGERLAQVSLTGIHRVRR